MMKTTPPASMILNCISAVMRTALLGGCLLAFIGLPATAAPAPDQRSLPVLQVSGGGAVPNSQVTLSVSSKVQVSAQVSATGDFAFKQIPYDFSSPLSLSFTIPVVQEKKQSVSNQLNISLHPDAYAVRVEGRASKAASVALANSSNGSSATVSGPDGYFKLSSSLFGTMKPEKTAIVASIINVKEECCPRAIVPSLPVTVSIKGSALNLPPVAATSSAPPVPSSSPADIPPPTVDQSPPGEAAPAAEPQKQPEYKPLFLPFGKTGELTYGTVTHTASLESVVTSAGSINSTWVEGLRQLSTQVKRAIILEALMVGGFIDGRAHLKAQLALQSLAAQAVKDYTPSEALCRFATVSKGLAYGDSRAYLTKLALNEALGDRETMRRMTAYGLNTGYGDAGRVRQFRKDYCDTYDESNGFSTFCDATATSTNLNKDVDFTRLLDTPLTLPVNFGASPTTAQLRGNADVMAFANNLFNGEVFRGLSAGDFERGTVADDDIQNYRAVVAARSMVRNSYTSLVGMKAEGTAHTATPLGELTSGLGFSAADRTRLIGNNPSYYAHMEYLTKKIYQDPAFYAHLYDTPANISRQRAAMRGVSLQQQADLLESLKRREMLLSTLLELRIRNLSEENADR